MSLLRFGVANKLSFCGRHCDRGKDFPQRLLRAPLPILPGTHPRPPRHRATQIMHVNSLVPRVSTCMNCFGLPRIRAAHAGPFLRCLPGTSGGQYRLVPGLHILEIVLHEQVWLDDGSVWTDRFVSGALPLAPSRAPKFRCAATRDPTLDCAHPAIRHEARFDARINPVFTGFEREFEITATRKNDPPSVSHGLPLNTNHPQPTMEPNCKAYTRRSPTALSSIL